MSLMMISMIFVMMSMSVASARRICEVLNEKADLTSPAQALTAVPDGSVDFDHVSFSYRQGKGKPVLQDIDLHIEARADHRHPRRYGQREVEPRQPDLPPVRCIGGQCSRRRARCA